MAAVERAVEIEPRSRIIGIIAAEALLHSGQYHAAVERAESTLSFAPDFSYAWEFKGIAHLAAGEFDEARAALLTMSRLDGGETNPVLTFIDAAERFAISGEAGELPDGLAELIEFDSYFAAPILVSAGQYEAALDYIERQSRTSLPETVTRFLRSAQFREALGDMPRYQDLVERLTTVEDGAD